MSSMNNEQVVPQWTPGDRVWKALHGANISVQDIADHVGVHRRTVGNWISGYSTVPIAALRVIALACDVPFEWLRDGTAPVDVTGAVPCEVCAARDSNPEPAD